MSKFIDSAESRETSVEVMKAIESIASSEAEAVRIWEEPTDEEAKKVKFMALVGAEEEPRYWAGEEI